YACKKRLRGVPPEIFNCSAETLSHAGKLFFRQSNSVLTGMGTIVSRQGQSMVVRNPLPFRYTTLTSAACKKATEKQLTSWLGAEKAEETWMAAKAKAKRPAGV